MVATCAGAHDYYPWHVETVREALETINALRAEQARLTEELECERMRLAACGVAADQNTQQSRQQHRLPADSPSRSGSYDAVCAAVDREILERESRDNWRALAEKYEGMLKEGAYRCFHCGNLFAAGYEAEMHFGPRDSAGSRPPTRHRRSRPRMAKCEICNEWPDVCYCAQPMSTPEPTSAAPCEGLDIDGEPGGPNHCGCRTLLAESERKAAKYYAMLDALIAGDAVLIEENDQLTAQLAAHVAREARLVEALRAVSQAARHRPYACLPDCHCELQQVKAVLAESEAPAPEPFECPVCHWEPGDPCYCQIQRAREEVE